MPGQLATARDPDGELDAFLSAEAAEHRESFESCMAGLRAPFAQTLSLWEASIRRGGKLLVFGNGGSAGNAQHIAAELVMRYKTDRAAIAAVALTVDSRPLTAAGNDLGFDAVFSRQIAGLGRPGDVAVGISTSGRSPNVLAALREARREKSRDDGTDRRRRRPDARVVRCRHRRALNSDCANSGDAPAGQPHAVQGAGDPPRPGEGAGTMSDSDLLGILESFSRARVLVFGDVMLDRFIYGSVERMSPEAPVPVMSVERTSDLPGGAANVARNVAGLGGHAVLIGVVGVDEAAGKLRERLAEVPSLEAQLVVDTGRPTTLKTRYIGERQQILRTDVESREPLSGSVGAAGAGAISRGTGRDSDIVVLSDYAKGVLCDGVVAEAIAAAPGRGQAGAGRPEEPFVPEVQGHDRPDSQPA